MADEESKRGKNSRKKNNKRIKTLKKYEKLYSIHKYAGRGQKSIETVKGKSVVAIAAPHSVNYNEHENKIAEGLSGGLTRLLASEVGCHAICLRKSYQELQRRSDLIKEISDYVTQNGIKVVIDIQIIKANEGIIYLEQENFDDTNSAFLQRALRYSFEYKLSEENTNKVVSYIPEIHDSVIKTASKKSGVSYAYLGISQSYFMQYIENGFTIFYNALLDTLGMLVNLDWNAEKIRAFRLWQSNIHKPQDKVEISFANGNVDFDEESLLNVCTYGLELEKVRLHKPGKKTLETLSKNAELPVNESEYIFLTNRLIEILFGREWIEGKEEKPGLAGAPIIVYSNKKEVYPIGMPKANQIDGVFFSSALYEEKQAESKEFDYIIFNRYTDSRLYIEYEKLDYADYGRVKTSDGKPAKKVMIPRYYKRLLGYLDYPLKMIRKEEYDGIIKRLNSEKVKKRPDSGDITVKLDPEDVKQAFNACYEQIDGEIFYRLRKKYICNNEGEAEADSDPESKKIKNIVIEVQNRLGLYNNVEILRIPKEIKPKEKLYKQLGIKFDKFRIRVLKKAIGKSEYLLKTEWTSETDDRNNIARLSSNMMSLLGVSENDKILVRFGKKIEILRALANDELTDYQIGIPAPARKKLGMNSVNDIVIVHRDMVHIFWRHSEEQTIAILGTVLAVFQVISQIWIGALLCLIVIPIIMYFVLNEERVKVK